LATICVLATVSGGAVGGQKPAEPQCNRSLMSAYKLQGRKKPVLQSIDICRNVVENCCTLVDQLSIVKLWRNYSKAHINSHIKSIMNIMQAILTLHHAFANLPMATAPVHFTTDTWVRYSHEHCAKIFFDPRDDNLDFAAPHKKSDVVHKFDNTVEELARAQRGKSHRHHFNYKAGIRQLDDVPAAPQDRGLDFDELQGPVDKLVIEQLKSASSQFYAEFQQLIDGTDFSHAKAPAERELSDSQKTKEGGSKDSAVKVEINATQLRGLQQIDSIKQGFHEAIGRAIARYKADVKMRMAGLARVKARVERELSDIDHLVNNAERDDASLKRYAASLHEKIPKEDAFNLQLFDDLYKGKTDVEDVRGYIDKRRAILKEYFEELEREGKELIQEEADYLDDNPMVPLKANFMTAFIQDVETKQIPKLKGLPFYPSRRRSPPRFPPIPPPIFLCTTRRKRLYRKLFVFNEAKYRYCDALHYKIRSFKVKDFAEYVDRVRDALVRLTSIKRTFYCILCDHKQQRFVDLENQLIFMDLNFCGSFVREFKEFFIWKDVILMRYLNRLFQYMECFQTPGSQVVFKYRTLIEKQYKKSFFVRRCLKSLGSHKEFQFCHFLCASYRADGFTQEVEGDLELFRQIYGQIVSFVRAQNAPLPRDFKHTIISGAGKNFDVPREHHDSATAADIEAELYKDKLLARRRGGRGLRGAQSVRRVGASLDALLNTKQAARKLLLVGDNDPEPLFAPVTPGPTLQSFKLVFVSNRGYNPLALDSTTDFDSATEDYVASHLKKRKDEVIHRQVLKVALFPSKEIDVFNRDVDLKFADSEADDSGLNPQEAVLLKLVDQINGGKQLEKPAPEPPQTQHQADGLPELDFIFS